MIVCPYCSSENFEGVDLCNDCGQPLSDTYFAPPANEVEKGLLQDRVSVLSPKPPLTVKPDTTVGEVLTLMVQRKIGCVIVADGPKAKPLGIFSERDALRKLNVQATEFRSQPVSNFMTPNPQTLVANAKIAYAVQRMDLGGYRHLPVVNDQGELLGIISARDIINYLTAKMTGKAPPKPGSKR
jgi:CBS domain-containing protein